jgi:fatty acid desaturase
MNRAEPLSRSTPRVRHRFVTARLIIETCLLFIGLAVLASFIGQLISQSWLYTALYLPVVLAQGLTLQRIYIVAHEAAHKKIAPLNPKLNDRVGQFVLLPMLVPLHIYRKLHYFHHGFNRRDHETSALDVFVSPWPVTLPIKVICYVLWYLAVFAGGFFIHSLVSIVIFLFLPTAQAQKISPAFKNWNNRDRAIAWAQFLGCLALHIAVAALFGPQVWAFALFYPMIAFAWIWSLLVYIFHYDTTIGLNTRYNVRAIRQHWFFSWLLMNFNQHATHHMYPNIPWYELPEKAQELPRPFAERNQNADSLWRAVLNQLKGPTVVYSKDENLASHLFVYWED